MAKREYDSKLSELLGTRIEALGNYLKEKEKFKELDKKADAKYDKETHEQRKKALEQLKKDGKAKEAEEKEYLNSLEKHLKNKEKLSDDEISFFKNAKESILLTQKEYNKQLTELSAEEKQLADLSTKAFKDKYGEIAKDTAEISKTIGNSLNSVFEASSKFMDGEIAEVKEKLEAATKELAGFQANLKKQTDDILSRGKAEAQAEIDAQIDADGDGDKRDRKQDKYEELEELERLYNLEAELDKKNEARKDDINYHAETLTQSEQDRFNTLKTEHATYTQSLDAKTKAEADAEKKKGDLEKEKAKLEGDLKTKESRKKKLEFMKQIVSASVNIAEGVTKALAMGPIIGPIMAGIVGAAGAVQLAVMSSQSKKFEDGGLLHGSRHSQGGMRIQGSNIEVEGGEYVVNRDSTDKNLGLIRYINSQRRELAPTDINSFFAQSSQGFEPPFRQALAQGGQLPNMEPTANIDNQLLVQAIQSIRFEPKVSVTDINTVQSDIVKVDAWVGM